MTPQGSSRQPRAARRRGLVRFVLVEPRHGGNVGAAARALRNLGFDELALVRPHCDPLGDDACRMAVDAAGVLRRAAVCGDLDEALAGFGTVAGTTRRAGKQRRPHHRVDLVAEELVRAAHLGGLALVFGREDRGLHDDELDRCTHLVHLDAEEDFASFNLSQAILLVAYELRRARGEERSSLDDGLAAPAEHGEREAMYEHLRRALLRIGFLQPDTSTAIMRSLRRMLGRAAMTPREVRILRGMARQIDWVSDRAELPRVNGRNDAPPRGAARRSRDRP